jgi:hypothetical protein
LREFGAVRRVQGASGGDLFEAEFALPDSTITVSVDPAANYMIRRVEMNPKEIAGYHSVIEVNRFKEHAPGVYFPEQVTVLRKHGDAAPSTEIIKFTDVVVNSPIPASLFTLKFPHGIYVTDRIEGRKYRVNENGQPIGPKTEIPVAASPPIVPPVQDYLLTETKTEPPRTGWWILPASVGIVTLAGAILAIRKWKSTRGTTTAGHA